MGAGTVLAVIIVLIIIGAVAYIFFPQIQQLIAQLLHGGVDCSKTPTALGCKQPPVTPTYSNDVIQIKNYAVSNINPTVGSATTLDFDIENFGENGTNVEVNFFDIPGFSDQKFESNMPWVECEDFISKSVTSCKFYLEPQDSRHVALHLTAPSEDVVSKATPFTISYYIKYDYPGYRRANIPVIDGITRTKPISQFSQSNPTYGPVEVDFEPPVGIESKEGSTTTKQYWIMKDQPFELKLNFKSVSNPSRGEAQKVNISAGYVGFRTLGTLNMIPSDQMPCNFNALQGQSDQFTSNKFLVVPGPYM